MAWWADQPPGAGRSGAAGGDSEWPGTDEELTFGPDREPVRVPRWLRPVAAVAAVAAVTGWVLAGHRSDTTRPGEPGASPAPTRRVLMVDPPIVGTCHDLAPGASRRPTASGTAVPCGGAHEGYTVALLVPHQVSQAQGLGVSARAGAQRTCQDAVEGYTGSGDGVQFSELSGVILQPTDPHVAAGQRWLRCDVVAVGPAGSLRPFVGSLAGALRAGPDLRYALCVARRGHTTAPIASVGALARLPWLVAAPCDRPGSQVAVRTAAFSLLATVFSGAPGHVDPGVCRAAERRFAGLRLHPLLPPRGLWPVTRTALCVASRSGYGAWVAHGKPLAG